MLKKLFGVIITGCLAVAFLAPMSAAESKYDIKEMTPQVEEALKNRRDRFARLKELKKMKLIGENNQGYVQAFSSAPEAAALVTEENKDRKVIYETIAEQNNLTDAMETIQKVFAQVQRDKAMSGERIQLEDGTWVVK